MELDKEQVEAVSYGGRHLLVRAGPGSGKTAVITKRAKELASGGLPHESILCMTFTEKAAGEMRDRLLELGIDDIWVGTMHSLCLEILKEHGGFTGITDKTGIMGEISGNVWCIRNVDRFGLDPDIVKMPTNPLNKCKAMMGAVRMAKREMITVDDLGRYSSSEAQDAAGKKKRGIMGELAKVYRAYDAYKKKNDMIDYDDMVSMVVDFLGRDEAALEMYRNKIRHVLVDEFQDNNYAQFELARILASDGDITVVGDENQSIMGFQGAFGGIFDEFSGKYADGEEITLSNNYRCTGHVTRVSKRLLDDQEQPTGRPEKSDGDVVDIVEASDEAAELNFVADTISGSDTPYGKVAILCSTNNLCQRFAAALRARDIPVSVANSGSATNRDGVEIMALLRVADSPETTGKYIGHLLRMRGIREYNVKAIMAKARETRDRRQVSDCVYQTILNYSGSDQDVEIRDIADNLAKLAREARSTPLQKLLHDMMGRHSDVYKRHACGEGSPEDLAWIQNMHKMALDYSKHYPDERLSDFIDYATVVDDMAIPEWSESNARESDSVKVMTVHKSKGMEFHTVFVTGLNEGFLKGAKSGRDFEMPAELLKGTGRPSDHAEAKAIERRNGLYVAMTRAESRLYLTYTCNSNGRNSKKIFSLLDGLAGNDDPDIRQYGHSYDVPAAAVAQDALDMEMGRVQEDACKAVRESRHGTAAKLVARLARIEHVRVHGNLDGFDPHPILDACIEDGPPIPLPDAKLVNEDTLSLSPSKIADYQRCPLMYMYAHVIGLPGGPSIYLSKGGAVHAALEYIGKARMNGRVPDVAEAVKVAKDRLKTDRAAFAVREYDAVEASLEKIVRDSAEWDAKSSNTVLDVECKIGIVLDDIPYHGKIDRIEKNASGGYEVIDFKTGKTPLGISEIPLNPQLNIYSKAMEEKYESLPSKASLVYVEKLTSKRECIFTQNALKEGLEKVKEAARSIIEEQFDATPGHHCGQCSYKDFCPDAKK